ncbi:MFS transporter [Pseudoroseicyclus sp. CXY001]|uniref:MFS transporter n=1 Tax=Pseudoroseicyclus sp. CXY001 TaxID=3242492 RepID=UPI00358DCD5D
MSATAASGPSDSVTGILRLPEFRRLWAGSVASIIGNTVVLVSAGWLMTTLTDSALLIALVHTATTLPVMLLSIPVGVLSDGFERRNLMLAAHLFLMAIVALLSLLALSGVLSPLVLLSLTCLVGCGSAFYFPAWQASIGDLVPREEIPSAVALNNVAHNIARCIGPATTGILLAAVPAWIALALGAMLYAVMSSLLLAWRPAREPRDLPREGFFSALRSGLVYVLSTPTLTSVVVRNFVFAFGAVHTLALLPVIATSLPRGGPAAYGMVLSCYGFGALLSAFLSKIVRNRIGNEWMVRFAFLAVAACALGSGFATSLWQLALILPLGGFGSVAGFTCLNSTMQLSAARWVVGRVMSIHQTSTFAGLTTGSIVAGAAADALGLGGAMTLVFFVLLGGAALGLLRPMPPLPGDALQPLGRFVAPELPVSVRETKERVVVQVPYRVPEEDTAGFLAAIEIRSRARRRDGAQRWQLLQDIETPGRWIETYSVENWIEYQRHNSRQTIGDRDNIDLLRGYRDGAIARFLVQGPRVQQPVPMGADPARHGV